MKEQVRYRPVVGRFIIFMGIIFAAIFILGAIFLKRMEIGFNTILAIGIIYIGWGIIKHPYLEYNENELILYSFYGGVRKHFVFDQYNEITVKKGRLLLNGKKIKANNWFMNQHEWNKMLKFYDSTAFDSDIDVLA